MKDRLVSWIALAALALIAGADDNPFHDPFEQATHGVSTCPAPTRPQFSDDDLRREAHQRMEAGTTCWLAGQCEQGGPYKHDAEINADVVASLRSDRRFANTSLWIETLRGYVTLYGCVPSRARQRQLYLLVKSRPRVKIVWNKTAVVRFGRARDNSRQDNDQK